MSWMEMKRDEHQKSQAVRCPRCLADVGYRCVTRSGYPSEWPHGSRSEMARLGTLRQRVTPFDTLLAASPGEET